jgi:hypothetical protein
VEVRDVSFANDVSDRTGKKRKGNTRKEKRRKEKERKEKEKTGHLLQELLAKVHLIQEIVWEVGLTFTVGR